MKNVRRACSPVAAIISLPIICLAPPLWAQSGTAASAASEGAGGQNALDDIVVTAERRESTIQDAPLAITAVSGDDLVKKGVTSIEQISSIAPAVAVNNEGGTVKVNIRGLGLNSYGPALEGNVAVYTNGVYLAHPQEIGTAFLDVQRIEVLRGPQGTLYGRNSTGGAINILPNSPTAEMSAGLTLSYGNYDDVMASGFISGPVVQDKLNLRFAAQYENHDGYWFNTVDSNRYGGLDQIALRVMADIIASERVKLTLSADYLNADDDSVVPVYLGQGRTREFAEALAPSALDPVAAVAAAATVTTSESNAVALLGGVTNAIDARGRAIDPRTLYQDSAPVSRRRYWGLSGALEAELDDNLTFRSITGYRNGKYSFFYDGDQTTALLFNYTQQEKWRTFSEEVQLLGSFDRLEFIVGGYYFDDKEPTIQTTLVSPFLSEDGSLAAYAPFGSSATKAYAAFGQFTYALTDTLKLTLGGRYGYEKRRRSEFADPSLPELLPNRITSKKFVPKATLLFEPTRDLTFYATVSQGFKSAAFLVTALQDPVKEEELWNYEAGAKMRFFNNALQVNIAGYHYDYKNLQVPVNVGVTIQTQNAAAARINGGELAALIRDDVVLGEDQSLAAAGV